MGTMLDDNFEDDTNFEMEHGSDTNYSEDNLPKGKDAPKDADIIIDVVDDTPEEDRGKITADDPRHQVNDGDDDEVKSYSERVQKRIQKETARFHAERRSREEREKQLQELTDFSKRLLAENNSLKGIVENGEKVIISEHQGRIESQLTAAKIAYREAIEAADINGQIAAQEQISKATAALDRLSTHRVNPIPRTSEDELKRYTDVRQAQTNAGPDERALSWQQKNRWFGKDEMMTAAAMGLHNHLVNREGILPSDPDYYKRIDNEMRKRFPERFETDAGTPRRTQTNVGTATRTGGKTVRKVTLTETQAKLARRLGLTMEQYAEQLIAENGAKEWTHG